MLTNNTRNSKNKQCLNKLCKYKQKTKWPNVGQKNGQMFSWETNIVHHSIGITNLFTTPRTVWKTTSYFTKI